MVFISDISSLTDNLSFSVSQYGEQREREAVSTNCIWMAEVIHILYF